VLLISDILQNHYLTEDGIDAVKRLLVILSVDDPTFEYCPRLLDMTAFLISFMSETEAFAVIYNLRKRVPKNKKRSKSLQVIN